MSSTAETGHTKNVSNTETLIEYCNAFGARYNPSNEDLLIANLVAMHLTAKQKLINVSTQKSAFKEVEGQRIQLFAPYKKLATRIINALSSSGAPATVIADAITINRKMQGTRAPGSKAKFDKDGKPIKRISVSQQSYDSKIQHLSALIELLSREQKYNPNEEELKVATLKAYLQQLEQINKALKVANSPYTNALIDRNKFFYTPQTGMIATVQLVKNYVLSAFLSTSPEYALVSSLTFREYEI